MNLETKYTAAITKLRELGIGKLDLPDGKLINLVEEEKHLREGSYLHIPDGWWDDEKPIFQPYSDKRGGR